MSSRLAANKVPFRDGELIVHESGEGSRIGYLHGVFGNPGEHPFLGALAAHRQVVAPTLPGFNDSPARAELRHFYDWVAAVSEIIDLAGITGRPMVASSVGAMLALEVAAMRPEAFSALVLIAPLGLWDDDDPVADLFARSKADEQELLITTPGGLDAFFPRNGSESQQELIETELARYATRISVAALVWGIPDHGLASRLHRVTCPVTLVWGADDLLVPPSYLERFATALPNVVGRHIVKGARHQVDWDEPERVAGIAAAAFDDLAVGDPAGF